MSEAAKLGSTIKNFAPRFWLVNFMELLERFAYFGLRTVVPIYMVLPKESGGLQLTHIQKGNIFFWWAGFQALLPMFTGGFSDRYGYKKSILLSIILAVSGYLGMSFAHSYESFLCCCLLVATACAVFKPGIQGTIALSLRPENASVGWGIFYQIVNLGGFLGPIFSGVLRLMAWKYVFMFCALGMALNLIPLYFFKEPERPKAEKPLNPVQIILVSLKGLLQPRVFFFCLVFSGFWLMFQQVFDLLPNVVNDWVDSSDLMALGAQVFSFNSWGESLNQMAQQGRQINPEWLVNVNSLMILSSMVFFAYLSSYLKPLQSIVIGIGIALVGAMVAGSSQAGLMCILGVAIFSVGEMLSSPKKMEYLSSLAPMDQKGLFMGYANIPVAIGWMVGSKYAGYQYEMYGDKINLAQKHLIQVLHLDENFVQQMPRSEILAYLAGQMQMNSSQATHFLFETYRPFEIWYKIGALGILSLILMIVYDQAVRFYDTRQAAKTRA